MTVRPLLAVLAAVFLATGCMSRDVEPPGTQPPAADPPRTTPPAGPTAPPPPEPSSGTGGGPSTGPRDDGDRDEPAAEDDAPGDDAPSTTVERRSVTVTFADAGTACVPGGLVLCRTSVASDSLQLSFDARTVAVDAWAWWNGTAGETLPLRLVLYDAGGVEREGRTGWSGVHIRAEAPFRAGAWYVAIESASDEPASVAGKVHILGAVEES